MNKASKVSSFLKKVSKPDAPKKGSSVPSVQVITPEQADSLANLKQAYNDAESRFRVAEGDALKAVRSAYRDRAISGDFSKSINIDGEETPGVQFSFQDRFGAIVKEDADVLREELGSAFEKHFEERRVLTLKSTDDAAIEKLLGKLGEKLFQELFEVQLPVHAKPGMDKEQFSFSDKAQAILEKAQFKASMKLRS